MRHRFMMVAVIFAGAGICAAQPAAAYYHPTIGRFLQRDPLALAGDISGSLTGALRSKPAMASRHIDGFNQQEYERSQPTQQRDPTGLDVHFRPFNGRVFNQSSHVLTIGGDYREQRLRTRDGWDDPTYPVYITDVNGGMEVANRDYPETYRLSPGEDSNAARDAALTAIVDVDHVISAEGAGGIYYVDSINTYPSMANCGPSTGAPQEDVSYYPGLQPGTGGYKLQWYGRLSGHYRAIDCPCGDKTGVLIYWATIGVFGEAN